MHTVDLTHVYVLLNGFMKQNIVGRAQETT